MRRLSPVRELLRFYSNDPDYRPADLYKMTSSQENAGNGRLQIRHLLSGWSSPTAEGSGIQQDVEPDDALWIPDQKT